MVTMRSDSCSVSGVEQIDICGGKQQHAWDIADNVFPVVSIASSCSILTHSHNRLSQPPVFTNLGDIA